MTGYDARTHRRRRSSPSYTLRTSTIDKDCGPLPAAPAFVTGNRDPTMHLDLTDEATAPLKTSQKGRQDDHQRLARTATGTGGDCYLMANHPSEVAGAPRQATARPEPRVTERNSNGIYRSENHFSRILSSALIALITWDAVFRWHR
jgi:hypothetical protein